MSKALELGFTDIFSLEPIDNDYRPFRIKKQVFIEAIEDLEKLKRFQKVAEDEQV
jgi:hypothetical protein